GDAPAILLTFSPCGSAQTLQFLKWLRGELAGGGARGLLLAPATLQRSVELATDTFAEVHGFAQELGFNVGCNVESVSSRAEEVEASVDLVYRIGKLFRRRAEER